MSNTLKDFIANVSKNPNNGKMKLEVDTHEIGKTGVFKSVCILRDEDGDVIDADVREFRDKNDMDAIVTISMLEVLIKNIGNKCENYAPDLLSVLEKMLDDLGIETSTKY